MTLILFCLELAALLSICHFTFHLTYARSNARLLLAILLAAFWSGYICFSGNIVPNSFVCLTILCLLYCERWYFKLCLTVVYTLFTNILSNFNIYLYCMISGSHPVNDSYLFSDIFVLVLMIVISVVTRKKIPSQPVFLSSITAKGYLFILFVAFVDFFLSSVSSLLFYDTLNITGKYLLIIAILFLIVISIFLVILYFRLQHYHALLQEKNKINQKMLNLEIQHYEDIRKKNEDLRAFRHDSNSHITALQALAAKSDLAGLKQYIDTLSDKKEQNYYITTNHAVSDAILNYFYERLPDNTHFEIEGKFTTKLLVADSDLCIILSNLLKNAVEAVEREPADTVCKLFVSLHSDTSCLSILIENTCRNTCESLDTFATTKKNQINHGFGLKNTEAAIRKYDGTLELQHQNNLFHAYCYLRNFA